jgi:hypothetical protein
MSSLREILRWIRPLFEPVPSIIQSHYPKARQHRKVDNPGSIYLKIISKRTLSDWALRRTELIDHRKLEVRYK